MTIIMFEDIPSLLIIFAGLFGFGIALYLHHKKQTHGPIVCPLHGHCEQVIHSEFSRFFGIPVEFLGMVYYLVIAVSYGTFIAAPSLATPIFTYAVLATSATAFLFSLYLTFIQIATLHQLCTWCLVSAGLCTVIFSLAVSGVTEVFFEVLARYQTWLMFVHMIGFILGAGAVTITVILFFKFLRDFRISQTEAEVMKVLSQTIWLALGLAVVSGIGLVAPRATAFFSNPAFLVKLLAIAVIIVNDAFLDLRITPQLISMSFAGSLEKQGNLRRSRRRAFALGAVSVASWTTALLLAVVPWLSIGFLPLVLIYAVALAAAVGASQLVERLISTSVRAQSQSTY